MAGPWRSVRRSKVADARLSRRKAITGLVACAIRPVMRERATTSSARRLRRCWYAASASGTGSDASSVSSAATSSNAWAAPGAGSGARSGCLAPGPDADQSGTRRLPRLLRLPLRVPRHRPGATHARPAGAPTQMSGLPVPGVRQRIVPAASATGPGGQSALAAAGTNALACALDSPVKFVRCAVGIPVALLRVRELFLVVAAPEQVEDRMLALRDSGGQFRLKPVRQSLDVRAGVAACDPEQPGTNIPQTAVEFRPAVILPALWAAAWCCRAQPDMASTCTYCG